MYLSYHLKLLAETEVAPIAYEMIPRYPSITRDIALVVDQDTNGWTITEHYY